MREIIYLRETPCHIPCLLAIADIDECKADPLKCSFSNGMCSNTQGSYHCTCKDGYELDINMCKGKLGWRQLMKILECITIETFVALCVGKKLMIREIILLKLSCSTGALW